jgi:heme exporter protein C
MKSQASWFLGIASTLLLGIVTVLAFITPSPDYIQGTSSRLIYVHPAAAWAAYSAFGTASFAAVMWLWPRTRNIKWDHIAGAAIHIGIMFVGMTLVLGAIWGRPTWGVWFKLKDARMASTLVMLLTYLGVMTLRQLPAASNVRARRTAFGALLASVNVPIVHFSVQWWDTLHQQSTVLDRTKPSIEGLPLVIMLLSFVAFTLVFAWLMVHRTRIERWNDQLINGGIETSIESRQAEGMGSLAAGAGVV